MFWKEEMATGLKELDDKLAELVTGINDTLREITASRNPSIMVKKIDDIKAHCIEYFSYQETMMVMSNYPQYYVHKHSHELLIDKIDNVTNEYMTSAYTFSTSQLENVLNEWFVKHVFLDDKMFADFYMKHKG